MLRGHLGGCSRSIPLGLLPAGEWATARISLGEPHLYTELVSSLNLLPRFINRGRIEILKRILKPASDEPLVRFGTTYGGWWIPSSVVHPGAVAYSAGVGDDISFDLALHEAGVRVTAFDPTPRAIEFMKGAHPGEPFRFVPVGWWDCAETVRFYAPENPSHISHSIVNLQHTVEFFEADVDTVSSFMEKLEDPDLDIVKMDIEGAETRVIREMFTSEVFPRTLLVEFDGLKSLRAVRNFVNFIKRHGYSLVKIEGWNYSFVRNGG